MSNTDNFDPTFASILSGTDCWGGNPIKAAVAHRAEQIIPTFEPRNPRDHGGMGYCYDGYRCEPKNLGWRFEQNCAGWVRKLAGNSETFGPDDLEPTPESILAGEWDSLIEYTWHDAAGAEYYYRYEKDWG